MGVTYPIFSPPDHDSSIAAALNTKRTAEARRAVVSHPPRDRRDQGQAPGRLTSLAYEPQRTAQGGYFIWVERSWLNKLEALRQPGEGLQRNDHPLGCDGGRRASGAPRRRAFPGEDPPPQSLSALSETITQNGQSYSDAFVLRPPHWHTLMRRLSSQAPEAE